jgi:hypothetical protein
MAGEECPTMLSSIDSQALKVGITKRKVEETAMAGEKGCTTERKAAASNDDGGLKEEKLQVEVKPLTLILDSEINQPEELDTLISNSSEPDESKTLSPNGSVSKESDADCSEPEDLDECVSDEYMSAKWADMMAELGFEDSDFAEYRDLFVVDNQQVEDAA